MDKTQAAQWVQDHDDDDELDDGELDAAFAALYEREPDDEDRRVGLWSLLCAGQPWSPWWADAAPTGAELLSESEDAHGREVAVVEVAYRGRLVLRRELDGSVTGPLSEGEWVNLIASE